MDHRGRRDLLEADETYREEVAAEEPATVGGGDLSYEEIAERAYELYEARGREDGRDMDDWLEAERELRARTP